MTRLIKKALRKNLLTLGKLLGVTKKAIKSTTLRIAEIPRILRSMSHPLSYVKESASKPIIKTGKRKA
jgi:hypothetical protein